MSAFLFYKPDSNPNRYSKTERFSLRCNASPPTDPSNKRACPNDKEVATSLGPVAPSVSDGSALCQRFPTQSMPTLQKDVSQDTSDMFNDAFSTYDSDDGDSFHSLFYELNTDYESIATSPAEVQSGGALNRSSQDNAPDHSGYCEIPQTDQGTSAQLHISDSLDRQCRNQPVINEHELAPVSVQPWLKDSQAAPDPVPNIAFPFPSSTLHSGDGTTASTFSNGHVETGNHPYPLDCHLPSCTEDHHTTIGHMCANSPGKERHSLEGRDTDSQDSAELVPNTTGYSTITAIPESRVDDFQQAERDFPSEKCSAQPQHPRCSSPGFADPVEMGDRHFEDDPCHPVVNFTATQERASVSQSIELAHHEEATDDLHSVTNSAASQQPDADVEMHDAALSCTGVTRSLDSEPEGFPLDEQIAENAHESSSVDRCLPYLEDGDASTPSAEDNMPDTHGQRTPSSHSSHPYRRVQPIYGKMSHVEIRNSRPRETGRHTVRAVEETSSEQMKCSCHPSLASGPWCLNGTTLSIDIREAERIPLFVGYSTFRVLDGQLFQSITLAQGDTRSPAAKRPRRLLREATRQRDYGAKTARQTRTVQPATNGRCILSIEQRRDLVWLREEGYTWNEIASRFPGKKKGTLQSIYYTQLKDASDRTTQSNQHTRHRPPVSDDLYTRGTRRSTAGISVHTGTQSAKAREHPRYSFRARRVP